MQVKKYKIKPSFFVKLDFREMMTQNDMPF